MKKLPTSRWITLTVFLGMYVLLSSQESACSCENLVDEECYTCYADEPAPGEPRIQEGVCGTNADEDWVRLASSERGLSNPYCIPD